MANLKNETNLSNRAIRKLVKWACGAHGVAQPNVSVRWRPRQQSWCRYSTSQVNASLTLWIRRPSKQRPYTYELTRQMATCVWYGVARAAGWGDGITKPLPPPGDVKLWEHMAEKEAKEKAIPLVDKRAAQAQRALERCQANIEKAEKALARLQKRQKVLAKRVRYYEQKKQNATSGPEFEAKLKELVARQWGESDAEGDAGRLEERGAESSGHPTASEPTA